MYIITNTCLNGEYTPSKAETLEEAQAWLVECTAGNIRAWKEHRYPELNDMSDKEVIEWAEEKAEDGEIDFSFSKDGSEIYYGDDSYNIMNIYDLDEI
jgi:hypothetical protein